MTGLIRIALCAICLLAGIAPAPVKAADMLCPDLAQEKNNTPGDVAGVQADIERLNLCVERAKLLSQLDAIAVQRQESLKKATSLDDGFGGSGLGVGGGMGAIPPLPLADLPALPSTATGNLKAGDVRVRNAGGSPLDGTGGNAPPAAENWKVRKIWGQGNTMRAQLNDGGGTLLNVVKGDPLPDGRVVETVSVKGVAVSQNGKVNDLSWDTVSDSGSSIKNAAQTAP